MVRIIGSILALFMVLSISFAQTDHSQVNFVNQALRDNNTIVDEIYITDHYTSQGITHTYFKQSLSGIPIYNSRGAIHYKNGDEIIVKPFFARMPKSIKVSSKPKLSASEALARLVSTKNLDPSGPITLIKEAEGVERTQVLRASKVSLRDIESGLEYYLTADNELKLIWKLPIEHVETAWYTNFLVDAHTGEIVQEVQWTVECNHGSGQCTGEAEDHVHHKHRHFGRRAEISIAPNSYEVFAWPIESPNFGGRTIEATPWNDNLVASPNGWHTIGANNYTTTRGNNTDTYIDDDNTNSPTGGDAARADGGVNLDFSFPLDLDMDPEDYKDAAVTNTFYWTNLMHDVWYNYGFDEASGNFQEENYTVDGVGSDYVRSEAQDGSGTCNANFGTPPDGGNPRMQMYLCSRNGFDRDGDYDNGVIAHEYGHGISNRLTGGPSASGCLNTTSTPEQMGEGWSDYLGMVMTIEVGDTGPDSRGMGTWLFGEGPDGDGIRPYPYSTDFGINPMTYNTINSVSVPHGVGSVWCTMLWDMTWLLIDEYGFDPDIYNGTGGNNIAMQLVMEGMKLQPCSPGFVDGRDAILEADELLYGGDNSCFIWKAFAGRGLGYSADQGSSSSRSDGTEAFDLPPSCRLKVEKTTSVLTAMENDQITYEIIVFNNFIDIDLTNIVLTDTIPQDLVFVSASDGGSEAGGVITFPTFDLLSGESDTFEVVLEVKAGVSFVLSDIYDDLENGTSNWETMFTGSTSWATQNTIANSGTTAWFAPDNSSLGTAYLDLAFQVGLESGSELSFFHQFDTEVNWDGGQVFVSTDKGGNWTDLGSKMTINGYNDLIFNSIPGFSGNSNGFINTVIDMDDYSGQSVLIRFQMNCDQAVGGNGWWIDDFSLTNLKPVVINQAAVSAGIYKDVVVANAVELIPPPNSFQASLTTTSVLCYGDDDGTINTFSQGGSGSYSYIWNDGETTQNRTNLIGGIYRVTISDGNESLVKVGVVAEPANIVPNFEIESTTNFAADNGSITVSPYFGTAPYTYLWETGETTATINNLMPGFYTLTITDDTNCVKIDSAEVKMLSCGDNHYDSGGPSSNYSNNEDIITVICPDVPDQGVVLTFNSFSVESNWDALYVYNGPTINDPLFSSGNPGTQAGYPAGGYYGTSIPGPFVATSESGCITLRFRSDQFVTRSGWDIDITCTPCAPEVFQNGPDGYGSLKTLIDCADPVDAITIGSTIFADTIFLDETLLIDKELIIDPGNGNFISIQSNENGPIFNITNAGSLELNNINLLSGQSDPGGAIINDGTVILKDVNVLENANNTTADGLIQNNGQLLIQGNSSIKKD
ncbi:MAG: M36 family metallopeptidase [Bacteroidota bacterium]